ncbi:MAG: threonine aldolase family protein [Acetobacteraceae bacterium]
MTYTPVRPDALAPALRANLYSDTQTRPSVAMKQAMMEADVGDEQHGDDPTVHALCERMAALLGKAQAVFLPSGTMCNEIAILTHCRRGDEVIAHESAHIIAAEGGAPGALAGVSVLGLRGPRGQFDAATLRAAFRERRRNSPPQTLVEIEQTANLGGGTVGPLELLTEVCEAAHEAGMAVHMDGARLMNAVVAAGVPAAEMAAGCDSVWLDFTKGLGAPLGAVLCGSAEFIDAAWLWKQRLGGSLRQAGICAAACLYALDHNIDRLTEDHANAAALARGLGQLPGVVVERPETNLVFFDTEAAGITAEELAARVRRRGVQISTMGRFRARACTHLDVDREGIELAIAAVRAALGG